MTPAADPSKALVKNPLGATGEAVAANVERLRTDQNLTFAALSERLSQIGRPIPTLGLRKVVAQTRRVDADDLAALAVALGVSPVTLLMPQSRDAGEEVTVSGRAEALPADALWHWLRATYPLPGDERLNLVFRAASWPGWRLRDQVEDDRTTQAAWLQARRAQKKLESGDGDD